MRHIFACFFVFILNPSFCIGSKVTFNKYEHSNPKREYQCPVLVLLSMHTLYILETNQINFRRFSVKLASSK